MNRKTSRLSRNAIFQMIPKGYMGNSFRNARSGPTGTSHLPILGMNRSGFAGLTLAQFFGLCDILPVGSNATFSILFRLRLLDSSIILYQSCWTEGGAIFGYRFALLEVNFRLSKLYMNSSGSSKAIMASSKGRGRSICRCRFPRSCRRNLATWRPGQTRERPSAFPCPR
jgi:hypothetical protein